MGVWINVRHHHVTKPNRERVRITWHSQCIFSFMERVGEEGIAEAASERAERRHHRHKLKLIFAEHTLSPISSAHPTFL